MKKILFVVTLIIGSTGLSLPASAASWSRQSTSLIITQNGTTTTNLSSTSITDSSSATNTLKQCLKFQGHIYEVCTAYIVNSQLGALLPYYKYAHSGNISAGKVVSDHLEKRYTGQARQIIVNRIRPWPITEYNVATPAIRIIAVTSDLVNNTATLTTEETWQVRSAAGKVVFQENNVRHTIQMQRMPSYLLHKWVVTSIQ